MKIPRIVKIAKRKLVGLQIETSISENKTLALWQKFKPQVKSITNKKTTDFYSIQMYNHDFDIQQFSPTTRFEKWAAIEVENFKNIPDGLEKFTLSTGKYAVFIHKGTPKEFHKTAAYIYGIWLPSSTYQLDNRPHFEIMSENYNPNDPNAEEEVWIPVKEKNQ